MIRKKTKKAMKIKIKIKVNLYKAILLNKETLN